MRFVTLFAALAALSASTMARERPNTAPPAELKSLIGCRAIASQTERLACYDEQVELFQRASDAREIVVVDREQIRRAQRAIFGFGNPDNTVLGSPDDTPQVYEAVVRAVTVNRAGKWLIRFDDSVWQTVEGSSFAREPKVGDTVVIKPGLLGSYRLTVAGGRPYKATRVK